MDLVLSVPEIFPGPRLKVQRARAHIKNLEAEFSAFWERNPYKFFVDRDSRGMETPSCRIEEVPPVIWAAILGDAIHNLRVALDHLANDLVAINGGEPGDARFPIMIDKHGWARNRKRIEAVGPVALAKIEAMQPYNGGDMALRCLHSLDIEDKHATLLPAVTAAAIMRVRAKQRRTGGTMSAGRQSFDTSKVGTVPLGISTSARLGMEYDHNVQFACSIVFGKIEPVEGKPILPVLEELASAVDKVISELTPKAPTYVEV